MIPSTRHGISPTGELLGLSSICLPLCQAMRRLSDGQHPRSRQSQARWTHQISGVLPARVPATNNRDTIAALGHNAGMGRDNTTSPVRPRSLRRPTRLPGIDTWIACTVVHLVSRIQHSARYPADRSTAEIESCPAESLPSGSNFPEMSSSTSHRTPISPCSTQISSCLSHRCRWTYTAATRATTVEDCWENVTQCVTKRALGIGRQN